MRGGERFAEGGLAWRGNRYVSRQDFSAGKDQQRDEEQRDSTLQQQPSEKQDHHPDRSSRSYVWCPLFPTKNSCFANLGSTRVDISRLLYPEPKMQPALSAVDFPKP